MGLQLASRSEFDELARKCDRENQLEWGSCSAKVPQDESALNRLETLTIVSAVLGGVCAGAAVTLFFIEGDDPAAGDGARLRLGPGHVQVEGRF